MKRLLVVLCALPLFALNSAGCSDSETTTGGDRTAAILALTGDATAGMSSFTGSCGLGAPSCHNADGTAGTGSASNLTMTTSTFTDKFIVDTMVDGTGDMTPQGHLSDQVLADILAYMRSEWGGG